VGVLKLLSKIFIRQYGWLLFNLIELVYTIANATSTIRAGREIFVRRSGTLIKNAIELLGDN